MSSLAGILSTKVAIPDYEQLADSIKADALLLYPDTESTACTFRTKPTWFISSKDLWTATLNRNADKLVLKEIHERSSREAVLKALDSEVKRTLKENRKQMELEGDYALGEEFEERGMGDGKRVCAMGCWRLRD